MSGDQIFSLIKTTLLPAFAAFILFRVYRVIMRDDRKDSRGDD